MTGAIVLPFPEPSRFGSFAAVADVTDRHGAPLRLRAGSGGGMWMTTDDDRGEPRIIGLFDVDALTVLHKAIGAHLAAAVTE